MENKFKGVKCCLWDVDLTFYTVSPPLEKEFRQTIYSYIAQKLNISPIEAKKAFDKEHQKSKSKTATFEALGLSKYAVQEAIDSIDKKRYLKKDPRLINLFENLKSYQHVIITNTTQKSLAETLKILGLEKAIFKAIITKEDTVHYKPNPEPFLKALKILKVKAEECVSIGDSENKDIIPPRKLGMKTIMVWGKSKYADISVPTVYDVQKLLS
jgi:HAD superfamily hydrolase (TIGR01549 family)